MHAPADIRGREDGPLLVLEPGRVHADAWRELARARELLAILVWRDFTVRYRQTALGVAWALLRPVLTMVVLSLVFGRLAGLPSGDVPYPLLVLAAMLPWQCFSGVVAEAGNAMASNAHLVRKVWFPRLVVPLATVAGCFVEMLIASALLAPLLAWHGIEPTWRMLTLPLWTTWLLALATGAGAWAASLGARYRDFRHVVPFVVQFGLYASPVGISSALVPSPWIYLWFVNPMAGVIEGFRWALLAPSTTLPPAAFVVSLVSGAALVVAGLRSFRRVEASLPELL